MIRSYALDPARLQMRARQAAHAEWESRCERLLDRYLDNQASLDDFRDHLHRLYPHNASLMMNNLLRVNLVRKIVDAKARVYRQAPQRVLVDRESGAPLAPNDPLARDTARLLRQVRLNAKMKWLMRFYELFNSAVLWGQLDPTRGLPSLSVLAPHQLLVDQDPAAPHDLQRALAIYVPLSAPADSPLGTPEPLHYLGYRRDPATGDITVNLLHESLEPLEEQPPELAAYVGLRRYPFALIRKGEPLDGELFPDVPHTLLLVSDWLDHELTRGALNARQVDFPAYAFNGTAEELGGINPVMGAGSVLCLGDDEKELKLLPVDAREAERNDNAMFVLKLLAQMSELAPSAFSFDTTPLSGTAKFHDKQPEIEYREDLIDLLVPFEEEDVFPMLAELAARLGFPESERLAACRLGVTFSGQVIPLSQEEDLANLEREFRLGLRTPADIIAERFGLDHDAAEARYRHNLSLYKNLAPDA